MAFAIEMYFDADADAAVRSMWLALEEHGVRSAGSGPVVGARPHVSLCVFDAAPMAEIDRVLRGRVDMRGLPLTLASLGFFPTTESVAFLGVVPTRRLLRLHRAVADEVRAIATGYWPYYVPDAFVPHCTLASHVHDLAVAAAALTTVHLPVVATVRSVGVIEVPSGELQLEVAADADLPS